jgi:hypothetical protein
LAFTPCFFAEDVEMKRWLFLLFVLALFFSLAVFACGDDDDDNDDGDDDDNNDDTADDDTPDDSWADGFDPCLPYEADEGWFSFTDYHSKALDFYNIFGEATTACEVSLNADTLVLNCPNDWSITAHWLKGEGGFPLTDGQDVNVIAENVGLDSSRSFIWVLDKGGDTLLFYANTDPDNLVDPLPEADNDFTESCAYLPDDAQPPMSEPWLEIFGRRWEGMLTGSHFTIESPGHSAISDDGKLIAYLPVGYVGVIESTWVWKDSPKPPKSTTIAKFLMQAMKYEPK